MNIPTTISRDRYDQAVKLLGVEEPRDVQSMILMPTAIVVNELVRDVSLMRDGSLVTRPVLIRVGYATGGPVKSGTAYIVGEHGPEGDRG